MSEANRRRQLLELAADLFLQNGYHGTSMRDLARAAGISQSTIYHYFHSKADLLVDIHSSLIDDLLPRLEAILREDHPPQEKLRLFVHTTIDLIATSRKRMAAFLWERRFLPPEQAREIQTKRDRVDRILDEILLEGIRAGAFRDVRTKSARMAILGMVLWTVEWMDPAGPVSPQQFADDFTDIVMRGIGCPSDSGGQG
jgi:AcrR family transcriptional regulator